MTPDPAAQSRIHDSFRRALASYHGAASAQAQIAALLADALQAAGAPPHFAQGVEFGCGTGLLTAEILQRYSFDQLLLNDLVAECAMALQPILKAHQTPIRFLPGAIETLALPARLDLIASASTVQWVQDPAGLLKRLTAHLAPGGWLALSGFGRDHFPELQALTGLSKAPSYLDAQDWPALLPAGLRVHTLHQQNIQLRFPDAISLLRHLRQTGVNAGAHRHWTRADLADFDRQLRVPANGPAAYTLTYAPVFVIAERPV